jgi:membrane-associated phospholipid phosphatase
MWLAFVYAMSAPWMAPGVLTLAALVGLSRVALGVHYVSDVIVGQMLAVLTGIVVLAR